MGEILAERYLTVSPERVSDALTSHEGWLDGALRSAGEAGWGASVRLEAEFGRRPVRIRVRKRAHLEVGPPQRAGGRTLIPLTWEAEGVPGLFPVMDALIELHPVDRVGTRVVFWGRYDPPLGRTGDLIDALVAHRIAESSVGRLLDALSAETMPERPVPNGAKPG